MEEQTQEKTAQPKKYRWLRRIGRVMLGILIFLILLLLFIRSPWGQNIIVGEAVKYVEKETGTNLDIEHLFITFDGNIQLDGLYLEDLRGDTLVYSRSLEADIPILPIIQGGGIAINSAKWNGLVARIKRQDTASGFNYQFLMDTFVTVDTTATPEPLTLDIGDLSFTDFDITLQDEVQDIDGLVKFGSLDFSMDKLDLQEMIIDIDEIVLADAIIAYDKDTVTKITQSTTDYSPNTDTTIGEALVDDANNSPQPQITVGKIRLDNVLMGYESVPDQINIDSFFKVLETEITRADVGKNDYALSYFDMLDSNVKIVMQDSLVDNDTDPQDDGDKPDAQGFEWPDIRIDLQDLNLVNNNLEYNVNNQQPTQGTFNPNAIDVKGFNLISPIIKLGDDSAQLELEELQMQEASGINVKQFAANVELTRTNVSIAGLDAHINNNILQGDARVTYKDLDALVNQPDQLKVQVNFDRYVFDLADIFRFQPALRENQYLAKLAQRDVRGNLQARGTTRDMQIPSFNLTWGNNTTVSASGNVQNAMDPDNLFVNFPRAQIKTNRADLNTFMDEQESGVKYPENVSLVADVQGTLQNMDAVATLATTEGNVELKGNYKNTKTIAFAADMQVIELNLGNILQNEQLGILNLELDTEGSGTTINTLDATLDATVTSFTYKDYEIKNLPLKGEIENGEGELTSSYKDDNINANLEAIVALDSIASQANLELIIEGIDLNAFGITNQNVKAAGEIYAFFEGDATNYTVSSNIEEGIAVFDNQSYLLGDVDIDAYVRTDSTSMDVANRMLDLELRSNTDPSSLIAALGRHVDRYLRDEIPNDTAQPVKMKIKGSITPAPILRDVILPQLQSLDTITLAVNFDEQARKLSSDIVVPYVKYAGSEIDSLIIKSQSDEQSLGFDIAFKGMKFDPLDVQRTTLNGKVSQNVLDLDFTSYDGEERLMHVASKLSRKRDIQGIDNLIFNLSLDDFILNKKNWTIAEDNELAYGESKLKARNFRLSNNAQSIELRTDLPQEEVDHLGLLLENFKLQSILSYLNPDEKIATGTMNGEVIFEDLFGAIGIVADLTITDLTALETPLGQLDLDASSNGNGTYDLDLLVQGDNVDVELIGGYVADENAAQLDMELQMRRINMETIAGLSQEFLEDGSGYLSGNISLTGTTVEPIYQGDLNFNETAFTVSMLNAPYHIDNESINLDNDGVTLNNFTIKDEEDHDINVDGFIGTENLINPTFNLSVEANQFTALDSSSEDNDLYYGKATFDASATIKGDLAIPIVDGRIKIDDETDFTYVIPAAEVNLVQRDGIVQFVNKENPDAILTQTEDESAVVTGFDIEANIQVTEGAKLNIIVDPNTGDNLQVSGKADLQFHMYPNGRLTLAGLYTVEEGGYELSLYEIVNRRFSLQKGSTVSWSGDPFDANMDVRAVYDIETSASPLMAARTSGADLGTNTIYRQELDFLVYLDVDGQLMTPEISFKLDMPEDAQGYAGGEVYGTVQQLNSQEQELNKQVFSLLVLNKFFPTRGSDGAGGGTASIARDNINQALSDQLNQFGGKLLGNTGVELNFGLDSYTDYSGGGSQQRTDLEVSASKKLLDDRLIVSVGTDVGVEGNSSDNDRAPVLGNVNIQYLLTPQGKWKLRGFRRNEFDNIIDGQLVISGISVIFTREFNKFSNLFKKTVQEEAAQAKREEEEQREKDQRKKDALKEENNDDSSQPEKQ
ncbi:translocation/assembly module TamB domain-containing protein [Nonlabens ponticola]|uniref:Translocation/assembly module TamB n=1 Tax=Nonlabens ponticola TaxID=2496866 RepID=A0A3S9MZN9_9FLAO|nr:translocation/assembly module TamB [Nonlabens ponticola]AZQ44609.1 translocation/assembly module TamB [Nonlabens ponticola]